MRNDIIFFVRKQLVKTRFTGQVARNGHARNKWRSGMNENLDKASPLSADAV